jgi:hypothetical protein
MAGTQQQAKLDLAQAKVDCRARDAAGEFKTRVQFAKCVNEAEQRFMGPSVPGDLLAIRIATRTVLFEKLDRKEITQAQAELEFAQMQSQLSNEEQQRNNATSAARTAFAIDQFQRMNAQNLQQQAMNNQLAIAQMNAMRPAPIQNTMCTSMPVGNFIDTTCY